MTNYTLGHCTTCDQMTNHLEGICQKCKPLQEQELREKIREILYPSYSEKYNNQQGSGTRYFTKTKNIPCTLCN